MKNLKYLALGLIAMLFASCDDKNVEYNYVPQDESKIAKYQLYYVVPCVSGSASNIYESVINGVSYVNNGAALLARYNAIPSGLANIFYTTSDISVGTATDGTLSSNTFMHSIHWLHVHWLPDRTTFRIDGSRFLFCFRRDVSLFFASHFLKSFRWLFADRAFR